MDHERSIDRQGRRRWWALEKVGIRLLTANMRSCLVRELAGDTKARRVLDRITEAFARLA